MRNLVYEYIAHDLRKKIIRIQNIRFWLVHKTAYRVLKISCKHFKLSSVDWWSRIGDVNVCAQDCSNTPEIPQSCARRLRQYRWLAMFQHNRISFTMAVTLCGCRSTMANQDKESCTMNKRGSNANFVPSDIVPGERVTCGSWCNRTLVIWGDARIIDMLVHPCLVGFI